MDLETYILGEKMKQCVITVSNQKGGVGKSTVTLNIGAALKEKGYSVLMIDLDAQCNLSNIYPELGFECEKSIYQVLKNDVDINDAIIEGKNNTPDLIPASIILSAAESSFSNDFSFFLLSESLSKINDKYDYIILDNGPNLGILNVMSFFASDYVLIPATASKYSVVGMSLLYSTIVKIKGVKEKMSNDLKMLGILVNRYNERLNVSKHNLKQIDETAEKMGTRVLNTKVHNSISVEESLTNAMSIIDYAPKARVSDDFRAVATEIEGYINGKEERV